MEYVDLKVEYKGDIALLILDRPEVLNALSYRLVTELDDAITRAEEDNNIKVIVVTGAGDKAFSAGADIHEQSSDAKNLSQKTIVDRRENRSIYTWKLASCIKPTIGAINGLAYGGGAVLASTLDIRIGCAESKFRFLAAKYGRINSTWTLPRQVGLSIAKELLFTGRVVGAQEALNIGLLNRLVDSSALMDTALEMAGSIASNDQNSIIGIKKLLSDEIGMDWQGMWKLELDYVSDQMVLPEVDDAFKGFLDRKRRSDS